MSILIKGIKLPSSCIKGGCPLDGAACDLWEDKNWEDFHDPHIMRHPDCPLIELPPHGRLIDADELKKFPIRRDHYDKEHGDEHFINGIETVMEFIDYAPTIIEAEEVQDG